jgi:hypothetical protein
VSVVLIVIGILIAWLVSWNLGLLLVLIGCALVVVDAVGMLRR